jgi:hypothetical protein
MMKRQVASPAGQHAMFRFRAAATLSGWSSLRLINGGHRFHGGLAPLQAGTPAVFIAHDDRVTEMLNSSGLPYIAPELWRSEQDKVALVSRFLHDFDLDQTIDTYAKKEDQFRTHVTAIFGKQ